MDEQKALKYEMVNSVFVDLDNTLLPSATLWPVWKAILSDGLRPMLSKMYLLLRLQSISKLFMASFFAGVPIQKYKTFLLDQA